MNETRRYRVRRELMILANSELEEQRRQADKWYLGLANKRLEYEDVEKLLGIASCDYETIKRLKEEGFRGR